MAKPKNRKIAVPAKIPFQRVDMSCGIIDFPMFRDVPQQMKKERMAPRRRSNGAKKQKLAVYVDKVPIRRSADREKIKMVSSELYEQDLDLNIFKRKRQS